MKLTNKLELKLIYLYNKMEYVGKKKLTVKLD